LLTAADALLVEHRTIERPPNGLGDLTAAVFLARLLGGQPVAKALQSTTAAVYEILARTAKRGGDELQLETDAQSLSHPMAMVQLRHLLHPGKDRRA
jgi:pyridoxine kinase